MKILSLEYPKQPPPIVGTVVTIKIEGKRVGDLVITNPEAMKLLASTLADGDYGLVDGYQLAMSQEELEASPYRRQ